MAIIGFCLKFVCLISTTSFSAQLVESVSYGPSLVSLTRWDRLVRGPTIFNPDTGRTILLEDYPNYSVVIPLAPDSPSATSNQVFISRRVSGPGEFSVEAPPGFGVMAVIQSLELRVADDTCNDFIMFSEVDGGGVESTGTCGKVDIRDPSHAPQGLVGPRTFVSQSGRMKILFYHGFIWGLVRNFNFDIFDSSLNPDLKVEVAFTAFKECPSINNTTTSTPTSVTELDEPHPKLYASCAPNGPATKTCIHQELFCDRTINCAFGLEFASDESPANCGGFPNIDISRSHHLPSTIATTSSIAAPTTSEESSSAEVTSTEATSTTTLGTASSSSASTEVSSSSSSTESTTEATTAANVDLGQGEIKRYSGGIGTDAAGLIGLVRKFSQVQTTKPPPAIRTIVAKGSSVQTVYKNRTETTTVPPPGSTQASSREWFLHPVTRITTKMPLTDSELFVDIKSDPIENSLIDGVSKEVLVDDGEGMSTKAILGIISLTVLVLIVIGLLRIYYCYNKVIWNPHGNLKSEDSSPQTPSANLMRKMKALAMESEEIFHEKKGKREQPPSYEILFPLPEEKDVVLRV